MSFTLNHHSSTNQRYHREVRRQQLSRPNSKPIPLLFNSYVQLFEEEVDPYDVEILWDGNWCVAACPGNDGLPCWHCGEYNVHLDQIVIGIDGACRNNGLNNPVASIGVAFGPESRYNLTERVREGPFTNQRAELTAAYRALQQVKLIRRRRETIEPEHTDSQVLPICSIVLKSDSAYVVKGLTDWVWKWETNGYRTSRGTPVENADLFQSLVEIIGEIEQMGVTIYVWQVPRSFNEDADKLAKRALNY